MSGRWPWSRQEAHSYTGVGAVLRASHRPPHSVGDFHPHEWEIVAWIEDYNHDALVMQHSLEQFLASYQGKQLPDSLSRGEALAKAVHREMNTACWYDGSIGAQCVRVDVSRIAERLYARWPRL